MFEARVPALGGRIVVPWALSKRPHLVEGDHEVSAATPAPRLPKPRPASRTPFGFSQLAEGRKKPGSTGLGLAICKSLVEMMGGSIGVESKECLDAGMDGHVCKPFRRNELAALIVPAVGG